jgi:hypothetical protein
MNAELTPARIQFWGDFQQEDGEIFLMDTPTISPKDVIVDGLNKRWVVVATRGVEKSGKLIMQRCHVRRLLWDDIVYSIQITGMLNG